MFPFEGVFQDELKLANIIPVYKYISTIELSNFRLKQVFNFNVCEKLMHNSLVYYLDKYNIKSVKHFCYSTLNI